MNTTHQYAVSNIIIHIAVIVSHLENLKPDQFCCDDPNCQMAHCETEIVSDRKSQTSEKDTRGKRQGSWKSIALRAVDLCMFCSLSSWQVLANHFNYQIWIIDYIRYILVFNQTSSFAIHIAPPSEMPPVICTCSYCKKCKVIIAGIEHPGKEVSAQTCWDHEKHDQQGYSLKWRHPASSSSIPKQPQAPDSPKGMEKKSSPTLC